jgi:hypothetical protein
MTSRRLGIAALLLTGLCAQQNVLVLQVTNLRARPISGVTLGAHGDGSTGPPTDRSGKTRIRLAPGARPGDWVPLQVVQSPQELVFISPWDARARIPFGNEFENFAGVVLAERGDRALLEHGGALASIAARIQAQSQPPDTETTATEERRTAALAQVAHLLGLDSEELDRAIRTVASQSTDPYERGMSALYQRNYAAAAEHLAESLRARQKQLRRVPSSIVSSAFFLGQALYEQGKYSEAADAYRRALAFRPDDPAILNAMGLALIKAGKPAAAEPLLERALELHREP